MNSNNQKPLTQNDKSPQFSYFSKVQNNININPTQDNYLSPISNVSILKTEEQKEIVRTDVYENNGSSPGKNEHFCVVTEVIRRKSNLPFDSKRNSINQNKDKFSFNQPMSNFSFNQNFQNKNLNQKNSKEEYKTLIKRIASQLNTKIKPPTQGFFFFAMQKGQYPLMIIKKIEKKILDHNIELDSDIFETYYNKYLKYRELVKKIAFLLKKNLSNKMFLKNSIYFQNNQNNNNINKNQNIQLNSIQNNNNIIKGNDIQINKQNNYNIQFNKNNNGQNNTQNNFVMNIQKDKILENKNIQNININYNVDRMNSYNNTNKGNIIFQNSSQPFTLSHKLSNVINPFKEAKNKNINILNFSKKNDFVIKNNPFILQSKNLNNNKKEINEDIEMKDESKKNFNIIDQTYNNMIDIQNNNNEIFHNLNNNLISSKNNSTNNNYLQSKNNQNITSDIKGDLNDQKVIINTNKSKKANIKIVLSTMKKSKEKNLLSNINNNDNKKIDISLNSIIIPKDMINITNEQTSFIKNFNTFMSNNSIYLEYNVPVSKEEKGQVFLIKDEFWQKYIPFIYINYLMNKENKLSLFSFVYLIEQYFTWCENNDTKSMTQFKEKIIECINKMHEKNNINKFLEMHRLNTLDELFNKYDYYIKNGNNKQQEIEIKIDTNNSECNCDICVNEKACLKKMSELNRKLTTKVKAETLVINAEYSKKNKNIKKENEKNNEFKSNNNQISMVEKNEKEIFSDSKVIHSFVTTYQFIPSKDSPKKKNKLINSNYKSAKKEKSAKKSKLDEPKNSSEKKREREILFDLTNNRKIEEYFKSVKSKEKSVSEEKNRKKSSIKKSSNKKESNAKSINRKSINKKRSNTKSTNKKYTKMDLDVENIQIKEEKDEENINEEKIDEKKIKKKLSKKKPTYPKEDFSSDSENEQGKKKVKNISRKNPKKKGKKF